MKKNSSTLNFEDKLNEVFPLSIVRRTISLYFELFINTQNISSHGENHTFVRVALKVEMSILIRKCRFWKQELQKYAILFNPMGRTWLENLSFWCQKKILSSSGGLAPVFLADMNLQTSKSGCPNQGAQLIYFGVIKGIKQTHSRTFSEDNFSN